MNKSKGWFAQSAENVKEWFTSIDDNIAAKHHENRNREFKSGINRLIQKIKGDLIEFLKKFQESLVKEAQQNGKALKAQALNEEIYMSGKSDAEIAKVEKAMERSTGRLDTKAKSFLNIGETRENNDVVKMAVQNRDLYKETSKVMKEHGVTDKAIIKGVVEQGNQQMKQGMKEIEKMGKAR